MKPKFFITMLVSLLLVPPVYASKEGDVRKGNSSYKKNQFDKALKYYESALTKDPESPQINFNAGVASYKNGDYDQAVEHLQKGLLTDDLKLKENVHYNLGNALYAKARELEDKNPQLALQVIQKSKEQFESVLKMDDKDKDALYNYEAAKKKEEEIAKKVPKKKSPFGKQGQDGQDSQSNKDKQDDNSNNLKEQDNAKNTVEDENSKNESQSAKSDANKENDSDKEKFSGQSSTDAKDGDKSDAKNFQLKPGEMSQEEAKDLLKQFEQNEQPAGLLNFGKKKMNDRPVSKDW
jgi:Ca-activated chloride channel family protein